MATFGGWFRRTLSNIRSAVRGRRPAPEPPPAPPPRPPGRPPGQPAPPSPPSGPFGPTAAPVGEPVGGPTFPTTTSHVPGTPAWPGQTPAWFGNEVELEDDYQERIETDQPMTTQDWLNEALLPADVLVDKYGIDNLDIMRALEKQGLISYEDWEDWRDMYEAIYG